MKIYLTAKSIPALHGRDMKERLQAIEAATAKMTVPEKMMLNIIKLLVLVPAFIFIFRLGKDWWSLAYAIGLFFIYPVILRPVQYTLCAKYIKQ